MSKLYLPLMFLALMLAGCSGSDTGNTTDAPADKVQVDTFYSADRAFADLRGPVRQCVTITSEMTMSADTLAVVDESLVNSVTLSFDDNGNLSSVVSQDKFLDQTVGQSVLTFDFDNDGTLRSSSTDYGARFSVKRDAKGYVTSFTSIGSNGDVDYNKVYTWNGARMATQRIVNDRQPVDDDGNPIPMPSYKVKYTYDDDGYLVSEQEESGDPQLEITITDTDYKYNKLDSLGNWTDREVTRIAKVYKINGGQHRTLTDSVAVYQSEKRIINY